jgi:hypothetical protein
MFQRKVNDFFQVLRIPFHFDIDIRTKLSQQRILD